MTEAPRYVPGISERAAFKPPYSEVRKVPYHLRRRVLKQIKFEEGHIPEILWTKRARAVEIYVQDVVATQSDIVDKVDINKAWDEKGPDLTIKFTNEYALDKVQIEVKSSSLELKNGKQKIRDEMLSVDKNGNSLCKQGLIQALKKWCKKTDEEKEEAISQRLTEKGIILINGGEKDRKEKTPEEILMDSFYPQLNRLVQKALKEQIPEESGQLVLFPKLKPDFINTLAA